MAEILQEGHNGLTELTIDEIFTQNSVHAVKNLHREYHASVNKAKSDLHSLVGRKYRDLIQIAEDIDKMNEMSNSIDDKLTNLSYRTSNHVSFGNNSFAKFESKLRAGSAKASRLASKHTIFNSLVNNQLLSFDLKLQGSAKISSRHLVYMAKMYFTIESVFQAQDTHADLTHRSLSEYKNRFNAYLENKIASQLPNSSLFDKSKTTIIRGADSGWSDPDAFDYFDGFLEEDQEDFSDDEDHVEMGAKKYFGGSSSPMSNFMVAYIILNERDKRLQTLDQVAKKIIDLRFVYLKDIIRSDLKRDTTKCVADINFSFIIAFTESTYFYVKKYLSETGSGDVVASLHRTSTWKASESIGFHNWLEGQIIFDSRRYSPLDGDFLDSSESKNSSFVNYLLEVFMEISNNSRNTTSLKQAGRAISLLHNFVASCRKAEINAELNESTCYTMKLFTWFDLPHKFLKFVVSFIEKILREEKDFIGDNLLTQIKKNLEDDFLTNDRTVGFFEKEVINKIDDDFENYLNQVLALSSSDFSTVKRNDHAVDACDNLKHWFNEQRSLLALISTTESSLVADMVSALNKPYSSVKPFKSWGKFDISSCQNGFIELLNGRKDSLKAEIQKLLDDIISLLQTLTLKPEKKKLHYILNIVHLLKVNLPLYGDSGLASKIDDSLLAILQHIFEALQTQPESVNLIAQGPAQISSSDNGTVPLWPDIAVHSSLNQLSEAMSASSYLSSSEIFDIFSCKENKALFISVKNSFISETLIQKGLIELSRKYSSSGDSTSVSEPTKAKVVGDDIVSKTSKEITDECQILVKDEISVSVPNSSTSDRNNSEGPENSKESFSSKGYEERNEADNADSTNSVGSSISLDADDPSAPKASNKTPASTTKLVTGQSRQLMANIAFLLCFLSDSPLTVHNDQIEACAKQINELSKEKIEESTLEVMLRGINELYKSNRNIYLPLSIN